MFGAVTPGDLLDSLGVESQAIRDIVTVLVLLGAVSAGIAAVYKAGKWAKQAWAARRGGPAQRRRTHRRAIFAAFIEGRIRDLDNKEEWSDHRFTELEAEVETVGGKRAGRGMLRLASKRSGLRRESSLSEALRKSRDPLVLVQGDPGSGKSVALRFVAKRMANECAQHARLDTVIPLYINLKALQLDTNQEINPSRIEEFVLERLREGSDSDVQSFPRRRVRRGQRGGHLVLPLRFVRRDTGGA